MATIKEIALKAGVSIGTVDRVLHNRGMVNAQTKERVEAARIKLPSQPGGTGACCQEEEVEDQFFSSEYSTPSVF